jgi:protocatechuate 3,4-dioxygenase beta subunit
VTGGASRAVVGLAIAVTSIAGVGAQRAAREPIVGLPCEGCEAVYEGRPASPASTARIAPAGEPGAPMTLTGRVLDHEGRPRAGVVVYAYHTNAEGLYPPPATSVGAAGNRHGRLRGWAVSGADGRYTFETIRPGAYPTREAPAHIHMHVIEAGCATYYIDDVMFTDDPLLTPDARIRLSNGRAGSGIATPVRNGGTWKATRDVHLGRGVPGYPACGAGAR